MDWIYDDGGRAAAGYRGNAGDCVARSIAIATAKTYHEVYDILAAGNLKSRGPRGGKRSARNGVKRSVYDRYLRSLGWTWTPTMRIGSGCTVHLVDGELPQGRLIVRLSKHVTAIIDGVIHDTYDPRRGPTIWYRRDALPGQPAQIDHVSGDRCVYGYWSIETPRAPAGR